MLKKRSKYSIFAVIGTLFFVLAIIFPIAVIVLFGITFVSVWKISPLISCASIVLVALTASFPLWCTKKRAWLAPLIMSFLILVIGTLVFFIYFFDALLKSNLTFRSFLGIHYGNYFYYFFIPIYAFAISFSMLLAGAMVARRMCNPSVAFSEVNK